MRKLKNNELSRLTIEEYKSSSKTQICIVLDNVRSRNNIGSVFRTSDAFLVEKIYLCGISSTPPNNEIHKTALGATESVEWEYYKETSDAVAHLKTAGYKIVAIEQTERSVMLNDFSPRNGEKYAIVFGHEVKGVNQDIVDLCDFTIELPQFGTKHSLNISVCAGIVIWDLFIKLQIKA